MTKANLTNKAFNWGLAYHFRELVCYQHGRQHDGSTKVKLSATS